MTSAVVVAVAVVASDVMIGDFDDATVVAADVAVVVVAVVKSVDDEKMVA